MADKGRPEKQQCLEANSISYKGTERCIQGIVGAVFATKVSDMHLSFFDRVIT